MLFNSFDFVLFFTAVFLIFRILPYRPSLYFLLVASYFFYGYWKWQYTGLLLLSTLIDYVAGLQIQRSMTPGRRKSWLIASVISNLSVLGIFKYYNFFSSSISGWFGLEAIPLDVLLPVGVSFYTFQSMSYTIDVYRGVLPARKNFMEFALYVSFFPQLVAGPIVRAIDFLPQLDRKPERSPAQMREGLHLVLRGFVEKVVIADNLAPIVERVYSNPGAYGSADLWIATYCFAFQIFCDFAGYTDIARGIAKILGFEFLINFRRPYMAANVSEFWKRWHISLSTWLRDYLYIPLGGSRKGRWKTYRNLFLTMVLGGLWHGANWTFLWWGVFHATWLMAYHAYREWRPAPETPTRPNPLAILVTFHLVCISWVLFRSESMNHAITMLKGMIQLPQEPVTLAPYALLCLLLFLVMAAEEFLRAGEKFERLPLAARAFILVVAVSSLAIFAPFKRIAFIYFQF